MDNYEGFKMEVVIHNQRECPICYENLTNYIILECDHFFCLKCHTEYIKHYLYKCPMCRMEIQDMKNNITLYKDLNEQNNILIFINKRLNHKYQKLLLTFLIFLLLFIMYFYSNEQIIYNRIIHNSTTNSSNPNTELENTLTHLIQILN